MLCNYALIHCFFFSFSPHYNVIVLEKCIRTKRVPTSNEVILCCITIHLFSQKKRRNLWIFVVVFYGQTCGFLGINLITFRFFLNPKRQDCIQCQPHVPLPGHRSLCYLENNNIRYVR